MKSQNPFYTVTAAVIAIFSPANGAVVVVDHEDLAKKVQNPVAALISLPLQSNFDYGIGVNNGFRYTLNVQPVIPFELNDDWNLISRTIVPFIHQENVFGDSTQDGLSDTVQSLFISPKAPTAGGWIWGAGPVLLLPTATDELLGTEKWGAGPSVVMIKQFDGWTVGALANHIWSYTGKSSREDVNLSFIQPVVAYTEKTTKITAAVFTDATYDWTTSQWTVPISGAISKVFVVANQPVNVSFGGRYYAEGPAGGPEWGLRLNVTFLFPK